MALSAFANHLTISSMDNLSVFFLAEGEQSGDDVMTRLVTFIRAAKQTLAFAIYDMRFSDPLRAQLAAALRDRAEAGVEIRFCYDADKPPQPDLAAGQDPAPAGTGAFVQSLGYPWRRIAGMKLMHSKFVVRDGQAVWTGSANMTDDAFTLMENNIVEITRSLWLVITPKISSSSGRSKTSSTPATFIPSRCRSRFQINQLTRV